MARCLLFIGFEVDRWKPKIKFLENIENETLVMKNLLKERHMKKVAIFLICFLISSVPAFADRENHGAENRTSSSSQGNNNIYSAVLSNGDTLIVDLSARYVRGRSSGRSEVRSQLSWKESGSWGSVYGGSYPIAWSDFESNSNGDLYENDPAHGASFVVMYAFPTASCSNGVMYFAAVQALSATSVSNLGASVSFTPLFGQICGTQISSLTSYTLTRGSTSSTSTSTSTGSTSTGTGSTSTGTN